MKLRKINKYKRHFIAYSCDISALSKQLTVIS